MLLLRSIICQRHSGWSTTARAARPIVRAQMIDQGWTPEGYGVAGVLMCSPL